MKPALAVTMLVALLTVQPQHAVAGSTNAPHSNAIESVSQQVKSVKGIVMDETGEPLIGVSVAVGAGQGTITDMNGAFVLNNVPTNATLTISYVGYKEAKVNVTGKSEIQVTLQQDNQLLDEVVVIGYGVQKKSNVTGAISSIKEDDMKNNSLTNAAAALQGKVSGVQVLNNSGAPGAAPTIRVRGYSSNGTSDPLYIVDGLKVSDISYLDPSSIKSMEILKDAASAAIYGAEAGNGVILITTKSGDKGKISITLDAQWTFSSMTNKMDMMNAEQYKQFYTESAGDAFTLLYDQYHIKGTDTDWQDEMYETGKMQKYNVGFQGGNEQGTFFVSLGYMNNDGMVRLSKDYYRRLNGQINASYKLKPWLEVGTNNTIVASTGASLSESHKQLSQLRDILLADPLTPVYYTADNLPTNLQSAISAGRHVLQNAEGSYYGMSWAQDGINPLAAIDAATPKNKLSSINGSTYANIKPFKNFVFTTRLGYTIGNVTQKNYSPIRLLTFIDTSTDTPLKLQSSQYTTRYYQWENFFNYTLETEKAGNFSIMAGMSYSNYEREYIGGETNDLSSDAGNFQHLDYSTNAADDYIKGNTSYRKQIAYYGRLSWDYNNRYNIQANFRADSYDSAYLDMNHNWGYFPSISAGWTFSNEEFMEDVVNNIFNYGKFRASYGINGSVSNLGGYMYAATLRSGQYDLTNLTANMSYWMNGKLYTGVYPNSVLANPKLRWERSKQVDLGLDLRFFDSRLSLTADYYYKLTDGLLVQSAAPYTTGASTVYQNLGEVTNSGIELELDWKDNIGDFKYGIRSNISTVKNKVKKYKGEGTRIEGSGMLGASSAMTYFEEGYPLWYIRGYKLAGVNAETGEAIYQDIDGKEGITDADRTELGKGIPDFTYGMTLTASWKNFDFNIYGAGASGNQLIYGMLSTNNSVRNNRPTFLYSDRWTSTNTRASLPSATYQVNDARFYQSDAFVFDASYFKIKQIQLGYTLPKSLLTSIGVQNLRAYVSLDNFFTFTSYPGSDPEINASANNSSAIAMDYGGYPMARSVSFGFNVAF